MNRLPYGWGKEWSSCFPIASLIVFKKEGTLLIFIKAFVFKELLMHFWREKYEYHTVDILSLFFVSANQTFAAYVSTNRYRFDRYSTWIKKDI